LHARPFLAGLLAAVLAACGEPAAPARGAAAPARAPAPPTVPPREPRALLLERVALDLDLHAGDADALYAASRRPLREGAPRAALTLLRAALEADPRHLESLLRIGRLFLAPYDDQDIELSTRMLTRAHEIAPDDPRVQRAWADLMLRLGRFEEAIEAADVALAEDPDNRDLHLVRGVSHYRCGRWVRAEDAFLDALGRDPDDPELRYLVWLARERQRRAGIEPRPQRVPDPWTPGAEIGDEPGATFVEVGARAGVDRVAGARGSAWGDLDGDGDLDLVAVGSWSVTSIYRNDGDGTFTDTVPKSALDGSAPAWCVTLGDVDDDGRLDVFLGREGWFGPADDALLHNRGGFSFEDVAREAGVADGRRSTFTASFEDADLDGDIDLYTANLFPSRHPRDTFFRNEGGLRFTDATEEAGLAREARSIGCAWGDVDDDGDPDLYVAHLGAPNRLMRNMTREESALRFVDVTDEAGVGPPLYGYVPWFWDPDADGDLDLFCTAFSLFHDVAVSEELGRAPNDALVAGHYVNDGTGCFENRARRAGLDRALGQMGGNFADYDADGHLDLMLANGGPEAHRFEPNVLFRARGDGTFVDVTAAAGVETIFKSHGITFADHDEDGDLDLYVPVGGGVPCDQAPARLYENQGHEHGWLLLDLEGRTSNRAAIGAVVDATVGARTTRLRVDGGSAFGSSSHLRLHLGLGEHEAADRLVVRWPASGTTQTFEDVPGRALYRIVEHADALERRPYGEAR